MTTSLSSIVPSTSSHSLGPPPKDPTLTPGVPRRLRSNSAFASPSSPSSRSPEVPPRVLEGLKAAANPQAAGAGQHGHGATLGAAVNRSVPSVGQQQQNSGASTSSASPNGGYSPVPLMAHTPDAPMSSASSDTVTNHSPHAASRALQLAVGTNPPPRPARAPLRSPTAATALPRSPSQPGMPVPGSETSTVRLIHRALEHSKDGGETLDLSRERIDRIGDEEVEVFRTQVGKDNKGVWRLALSYNSLRDGCITPRFASLTRLRYLNLKGNQLTGIPTPLCELQGLEILDLSKNQITAFPDVPGRLAHLKVLSLSYNCLTALPTYLVNFNGLKVFKVDHNPIQWPPVEILGPLITSDPVPRRNEHGEREKAKREEDLRPWIAGMKLWLHEQATDAESALEHARVEDDAEATSEDEPISDFTPDANGAWTAPQGAPQATVKRIIAIPEEHSAPSSPTGSAFTHINRTATTSSEDSLIHLNSSTLSLPSNAFQHDRSISASSLTPPVSASTTSSSHSGPLSANLPKPPQSNAAPAPVHAGPSGHGHSRGASYTVTQRHSGQLTAKKSLPDLRQSHAKIIAERRSEASDEVRPLGLGIGYPRNNWQQKLKSLPPPDSAAGAGNRTLKSKGSLDVLRKLKDTEVADLARDGRDVPAIDESRNSYFRRLSMLPVSTISKAVSPAMLIFIDAIRGLLFATSQLHAALKQYLNFAVPDRVAGVFSRVVEPAGRYQQQLINALDRFDSTSRRSAPPVTAVRGVVDAAKECIVVFGKIVSVLRLQTPAFKDADVRYTRQLLLSIYGGMSEIARSWNLMAPILADIRPLLLPEGAHLAPPMSKSSSLSGRTPISPILERGESRSPERAMRTTPSSTLGVGSMPPVGSSPRAKSRRHAGSFSTQDVERGMLMGSPSAPRMEWPDLSRTIFEDKEVAEATAPPPFPLHAEPEPPQMMPPEPLPPMVTSYSQPARSRHIPTSSAGSSYLSAPNGMHRNLSVDVRPPTPASATLFDEDLLDVLDSAIDIAFQVWLRLAEDIGASAGPPFAHHAKSDSISSAGSGRLGPLTPLDSRRPPTIPPRAYHDLVLSLSTAEQVTDSLRESLMGLRANPFAFAHTSLPDNAAAFIKAVVKVSEQIKVLSTTHLFSQPVRQYLSQLTQTTRECAILMQVSSLRPTQSTPASDLRNKDHHHHHHQEYSQDHRDIRPYAPSYTSTPSIDRGYTPERPSGERERERDKERSEMSSNEDLTPGSGLRGLHLPSRLRGRQPHNPGQSPPSDLSRFGREQEAYARKGY